MAYLTSALVQTTFIVRTMTNESSIYQHVSDVALSSVELNQSFEIPKYDANFGQSLPKSLKTEKVCLMLSKCTKTLGTIIGA